MDEVVVALVRVTNGGTELLQQFGDDCATWPAAMTVEQRDNRAPIDQGTLNLPGAWQTLKSVASRHTKFTVTSPYMLAKTLLDLHYHDRRALPIAVVEPGTGRVLAMAVNRHYSLTPNPHGRAYPNTVDPLVAGGGVARGEEEHRGGGGEERRVRGPDARGDVLEDLRAHHVGERIVPPQLQALRPVGGREQQRPARQRDRPPRARRSPCLRCWKGWARAPSHDRPPRAPRGSVAALKVRCGAAAAGTRLSDRAAPRRGHS